MKKILKRPKSRGAVVFALFALHSVKALAEAKKLLNSREAAQLEQYVDKNIKNTKYCARRIVVTEQAYFSSRSQYDALRELNVGEY